MTAVDAGRGTSAATNWPGEPGEAYNGSRPGSNEARTSLSRARARESAAEALKSRALAPNSVRATEFRELAEEPTGEPNHGRAASSNPALEGRYVALSVEDAQERDLLQVGGWGLVETSRGSGGVNTYGASDAGMTSHRGVLHPDEYVDHKRLVGLVEDELGFSFDNVHAVYRQGRLSDDQRELRERIDARLLALSRAGAQVHLLGRLLGLGIRPSGSDGGDWCPAVLNALRRARAAELTTKGGKS